MAKTQFASSVFLNCPFDDDFSFVRAAIIFSIYDCGFVPRCALELNNGAEIRIDKINRIISECKFGIHDISRTELDVHNELPRFNMPLELGIFLGAKRFGSGSHRHKSCLILDKEQYRYQQYISDIAGQDIRSHEGDAERAVSVVRAWLNDASGRRTVPGGAAIWQRFQQFQGDLPGICEEAELEVDEVTYNDYCLFTSDWLGALARDA